MRKTTAATFLLRIPEQNLEELQITSSNSKQFAKWAEQLPKANIGETAHQLYQCIQELNRVEFSAKKRFYLLETLRPNIHNVCTLLEKHYLNQALILPEKARKVASLAIALQTHLVTGYKIVVLHGCNKVSDKEYSKIITTAIHRAITDTGRILVCTYQLYHPVSIHTWHELYQLYRIAEYYKLKDYSVTDNESNGLAKTITATFCRCLLLATARPNQLRQQEIAELYSATELWSNYTNIQLDAESPGSFNFDLLSDTAPTYHHWIATDSNTQLRAIVVKELVSYLNEFQKNPKAPDIPIQLDPPFLVPKAISAHLLSELIDAWSASVERTSNRVIQKGPVDVCIGLKTIHYFASGEQEFDDLINNGLGNCIQKTRDNPFLNADGSPFSHADLKEEKNGDAWSLAYDGGGGSFSNGGNFDSVDTSALENTLKKQKELLKATISGDYDVHNCNLVDVSPGGYCLEWSGKVPSLVRTGELLGIREKGTDWVIGVIRWANHTSHDCVRIGVELLAPTVIACGAQIIPKTGEPGEFLRALLLPELKSISQHSTLLTPNTAFHSGYKINLNCDGLMLKAHLKEEMASTAAFNLFTFDMIEQQQATDSEPKASESTSIPYNIANDDFDGLWNKL